MRKALALMGASTVSGVRDERPTPHLYGRLLRFPRIQSFAIDSLQESPKLHKEQ